MSVVFKVSIYPLSDIGSEGSDIGPCNSLIFYGIALYGCFVRYIAAVCMRVVLIVVNECMSGFSLVHIRMNLYLILDVDLLFVSHVEELGFDESVCFGRLSRIVLIS